MAPLSARTYRVGVVAPGLLLGVLPVLGTLAARPWLAAFGWMMTLAACGDLLVLLLLRGVPPSQAVRDHPTRAGCVVLRPASV